MAKDSRPWIKLSIDFVRHPKVKALPEKARWVLLELWCYSMEYGTDGFVSDTHMAGIARKQHRDALEKAGFIVRVTDATAEEIAQKTGAVSSAGREKFSRENFTETNPKTGWVLHDYLHHQVSTEEQGRVSNIRRSAGRKGGQAKARNQQRNQESALANATAPATANALANGYQTSSKRVADIDIDRAQPTTSDDVRYVTRETRESSSEFSDGTPIPPEPPADPRTDGTAALAPSAEIIPIEIGTAAHPRATRPEPAHRTTVRLALGGAGYPKTTLDALAVQVARLAGKHPPDLITEALHEWDRRPNVIPAYLPTVLGDIVKAQRAQPAARRSTTDDRIAAIQALKHQPTNQRTLE